MYDIETEVGLLSLDEIRQQLRDLIKEQHQGKWIYQGDEKDVGNREKFDEWVRGRVCLGIALTARERGIQVEGKKPKGGTRAAKGSIAAAITEDLLS